MSPARGLCLLFLMFSAAALFGDEDLRDARGAFFAPSVGLSGHFDRIHVKDPGAPTPVNSILTCFGWGVTCDWAYFALKVGLRSQLGTSSLDPGYVDDEQLTLNGELQAKYPFFLGRLVTVFPTVGLEYAARLSGTLRNGEAYFPWLVRLGAGGDVAITDRVYLRAEASLAPIRGSFFSVTQTVGVRL